MYKYTWCMIFLYVDGYNFVEDFCIYTHKGYWSQCFIVISLSFLYTIMFLMNVYYFYNLEKICLKTKNENYPKPASYLSLGSDEGLPA